MYPAPGTTETELQIAKRKKLLKRIAKGNSHFAFLTEEEALEHLRMLKRRQVMHMKRELAFIERFLECEKLSNHGIWLLVPNSSELVGEYLMFD